MTTISLSKERGIRILESNPQDHQDREEKPSQREGEKRKKNKKETEETRTSLEREGVSGWAYEKNGSKAVS